jgi:hypothetical protein
VTTHSTDVDIHLSPSRLIFPRRSIRCFVFSRSASVKLLSLSLSVGAALRCVPTSATRGLVSGDARDAMKRSQYRSCFRCVSGESARLHKTRNTPDSVAISIPLGTQYSLCPAKSQIVHSPAPGMVAGNATNPCVRSLVALERDVTDAATSERWSARARVLLPTSPWPHRNRRTRGGAVFSVESRAQSKACRTSCVWASCRGVLPSCSRQCRVFQGK